VKAAFGEILFPILDQLEVTLAGRIDDYSASALPPIQR
jgi:hypothetical protein